MDIYTSKNHRVHVIEGDPASIIGRGTEIENLAGQMHGAADVLEQIGSGATEEKGRSIDKIREQVGDTYRELRLAGDRYQPTGTAMRRYGESLDAVRSAMRSIVDEVEEARRVLDAKSEASDEARLALQQATDDASTDPAAVSARSTAQDGADDARRQLSQASATLDEKLDLYDAQWDTWDAAYNAAYNAVNDATTGNVTDDWTDDLAGVVDVVLKVLSWVGVVLAIAALVIGGPIIAAIAAVVALVVLVGTVFMWAKGRRSLTDVAWAVVGVLPFGKLAKLGSLAKAGQGGQAAKGLLKLPFSEIATPIKRVKDLRGLAARGGTQFRPGLGRMASKGLARNISRQFSNFGGAGLRTIPSRILGGSSRAYTQQFAKTFSEFSAHHRSLMAPQLKSLAEVVESGGKSLSKTEMIANTADFAVKRTRMVLTRGAEVNSWFQPQPVDTWRAQLANS